MVDVADAEYGETPSFRASIDGFSDRVELLIKHGADVNTADIYNESPLHGAAANGQINAAKLLLENGADINKIDVLNLFF